MHCVADATKLLQELVYLESPAPSSARDLQMDPLIAEPYGDLANDLRGCFLVRMHPGCSARQLPSPLSSAPIQSLQNRRTRLASGRGPTVRFLRSQPALSRVHGVSHFRCNVMGSNF